MGREDDIKIIAYRLWEEDGCCHGRDGEHWTRAEIIWEEQNKAPAPAKAETKAPATAGQMTKSQPGKSRPKSSKSGKNPRR